MRRTVAEHQAAVAGLLRWSSGYGGTEPEDLAISDGLGRTLAEDVRAPVALPPFDNSQMDGYAVHADDLAVPSSLVVAEAIPAGSVPLALEAGTAAPIMTGAMLPPGAAAVVPIERVDPPQFYSAAERARGEATVRLPGGIDDGLYVRRAGSDIAEGEVAVQAGTLLGPAQLGLLAACGVGTVLVRPRFRVLLLSTGDEVAEPGAPLAPGTIYDANTTLLEASLRDAGVEVTRHRLLGDDPAVLREALGAITATSTHLVLSTGGISQGAYEVVKQALANSSVEFSSVALQPGGPQAHGTISGVPFLGFPGNPVSAFVSFEMFLRPALHQLTGVPSRRPVLEAVLVDAVESPEAKHQVRRGLYRDGKVALVGGPDSHLLHALAGSNCLVHLPVGVAALSAGAQVEVTLFGPEPADPFTIEDVLVTEEADTDGR
ncbi:molybdopterin molybdotransferase MoeA [Arthrobacter sp. NamB2]|uniref:molybdopterin molybdotransferase MoeA n=1 Tax=Arthrobacter sp. NamB2 TaxID=2576035 RepID=UPI0010C99C54|nr:gephyrin-like molybdotransferase Glp [Arthrobacter sp. NamB2]TKV27961.1 molybdopterin molybdotransferase MoeA [Arthrobacter sp. NamB2]